ncbi:MAG: 3-methyladenine DNA glycosylase [Deltaproteobacteria bacterium]|nr:MAG: 3-methyladenine DNA glycosylase [Deltaproteobacteria bacterium]
MQTLAEIYETAYERHGDALEPRVEVEVRTPAELAALGDDRWLAQMAQRIFSAGFVWSVVEAKWPGFEEAFEGFHVPTVAGYTADDIGRLKQDTRIIRNGPKIAATVENARFVQDVSEAHGGFGRWIGEWPDDDVIGLWDALAKGGSRLGGATGPMMLRFLGKDTFILSNDVVARLVAEGIVSKKPTSKRDLAAVQDAFRAWRAESGRSYGAISRILACSIDG